MVFARMTRVYMRIYKHIFIEIYMNFAPNDCKIKSISEAMFCCRRQLESVLLNTKFITYFVK